jgi:hypothetical protein
MRCLFCVFFPQGLRLREPPPLEYCRLLEQRENKVSLTHRLLKVTFERDAGHLSYWQEMQLYNLGVKGVPEIMVV